MKNRMPFVVFGIAASAGWVAAAGEGGDPPLLDEEVDLEEAAEWAELVDTFVSPDGVKMEIYLDEVQGLMWEQPADQPPVAEGEDFGTRGFNYYLVPQWLYLDDGSDDEYYYRSSGDITYWGTCGDYCTKWIAWGTQPWENVETVKGLGYSYTTDWTDDYTGQYRELDETPHEWTGATIDSTYTSGGNYYYRSYEYVDPDGEEDWYYGVNQRAIRFIYYDDAFDVYRYVVLYYSYVE